MLNNNALMKDMDGQLPLAEAHETELADILEVDEGLNALTPKYIFATHF